MVFQFLDVKFANLAPHWHHLHGRDNCMVTSFFFGGGGGGGISKGDLTMIAYAKFHRFLNVEYFANGH